MDDSVQALMNYKLLRENMIDGVRKSRSPFPTSDNVVQIKLGDIEYITRDRTHNEVLWKDPTHLLIQRKMTLVRLGQTLDRGGLRTETTELPPTLNDTALLY